MKTTLVVAGQLYTPLFYGVHTPSTFIAPIVEPLDVARQVVAAIEKRVGGEIYAPWYVGYMYTSPTPRVVRCVRLLLCCCVFLASMVWLFGVFW